MTPRRRSAMFGTHTLGLNDAPSQPGTPLTPGARSASDLPAEDRAQADGQVPTLRPPAVMDAELWRLLQTIMQGGQ